VKRHGIRKGDEVEVSATSSQVIIASSQAAKKHSTLVLADDPAIATRQINSAYKRGIDELEVQYENPKAYSAALAELKNLIGFEVVESGKRRAKIKNIATGEVGDFSTVLRRAFLILLEMAETTEEYCRTRSKDALEHVNVAEYNIDRLTDFCKRLLNKHGTDDIANTTLNYGFLKDIERIADHYVDITQTKVSKELVSMLGETRAQLRTIYELFYEFDQTKAGKFLEKLKQLNPSVTALLRTKNPVAAHHIAGITQMLNEMSWAVCAKST
jgi:phosphate uptake regulator